MSPGREGGLAAFGTRRFLLPSLALALALALTARHPAAVVLAVGAAVWLLVPLVGFGAISAGSGDRTASRLTLRYLGGHPAFPAPGRALLTVWPADGGATLRVGRRQVAFPLSGVRTVALADGRIEIPMGPRPLAAELGGRLLARRVGRFCGLRRAPDGTFAVVDRSRIICDIARGPASCRVVFTGMRGGGEEAYLEALLLLRPSTSGSGAGTPGGTRGGQAVGGM